MVARKKTKIVKKNSKPAPRKSKIQPATSAVSKPAKSVKAIHVFHTTERYAKYGKHVDDAASRKIEIRHELEKHVAGGKATLSSVVKLFGDGEAMLRLARLLCRGLIAVDGAGNHPTDVTQKNPKYWSIGQEWKTKLVALSIKKPTASVKLIGAPKHVSVLRKS